MPNAVYTEWLSGLCENNEVLRSEEAPKFQRCKLRRSGELLRLLLGLHKYTLILSVVPLCYPEKNTQICLSRGTLNLCGRPFY